MKRLDTFDRVAVIGDGGWGTALSIMLTKFTPVSRVALWSHFPEHAALLRESRINQKFLPGVHIPQNVGLISGRALADEKPDLVIFAVPTPYLRAIAGEVRSYLPPGPAVLTVSKGIECDTLLRGSQIITEVLSPPAIAVLSGPSHAEEVVQGIFTLVSVASTDEDLARRIQLTMTTETLRIYTCPDVIGVELGGALKNVIGLAAGMCDALGYGCNTKSALITRAIAEIARLGVAMGADLKTFYGLSGVGDLITTCISPYGRNRAAGELIGKGKSVREICESTEMVAEGIFTARAARELARRHNAEMPITEAIYSVMYEGRSPREAAEDLMNRVPREEH